jgi:hypothetical protein
MTAVSNVFRFISCCTTLIVQSFVKGLVYRSFADFWNGIRLNTFPDIRFFYIVFRPVATMASSVRRLTRGTSFSMVKLAAGSEEREVPSDPSYRGEFREGRKHGKGKKTFPDGSTFDGEWLNDAMHGKGTFTWVNGDVFRGEFCDGMIR